TIYAPIYQAHAGAAEALSSVTNLVVRADAGAAGLEPAVRRAIGEVDRDVPATAMTSMDRLLAASVGARKFSARLLEIFSASALLLAAMGLYATASSAVTRRTREIGIRIALGASPGRVLALVAGRGTALIALGVGFGLAASAILTRLLT